MVMKLNVWGFMVYYHDATFSVRPGRIKGSIKVADYLVAEAERLLNDALNALEVVSATRRGVDVNHVTLNFVYGIPIGFEELQAALAGFLERHVSTLFAHPPIYYSCSYTTLTSNRANDCGDCVLPPLKSVW